MKNILLPGFILLLFPMSILFAQDRITGSPHATRSEVIAEHGMVAASHPLATQIGIDILKKGGHAVDAAIAVNAAQGLMEPTGCGIGGDLFAIVWDNDGDSLYGLNASGRSPRSLTLEYFRNNDYEKIPAYGPLPVSVPGCVDGWFALHDRFGKLKMEEVLQPAIQYAEQGFPLTELIAWYLGRSVPFFAGRGYPNVEETYTVDGTIPEKGDIFTNPALAETYRALAGEGRDVFYEGYIAKTIAEFIHEQGGFLSFEDMKSHSSEWVIPVSVNYRGYDVWELPPNGQGIAALQMLNILESFTFSKDDFGTARHIHLLVEAKKLAFEDRAGYYADPAFADVPVDVLISEEYGMQRKSLIDPGKAGSYEAGQITAGETVYLAVADRWGNMVSLIQSNYRGLGSGMVPPGLGFMLQDRGELFSLDEGHANVYAPGKRPFHTIIPAFVTKDGEPFLCFGVMGGDFQPQGHVQILMNIIDFGMNIQEAGDAPRVSHGGSSSPTGSPARGRGTVYLESGFPYEVIRELMDKGHEIGYRRGIYGGYQAIMWDARKQVYLGASESRKDGMAAGY